GSPSTVSGAANVRNPNAMSHCPSSSGDSHRQTKMPRTKPTIRCTAAKINNTTTLLASVSTGKPPCDDVDAPAVSGDIASETWVASSSGISIAEGIERLELESDEPFASSLRGRRPLERMIRQLILEAIFRAQSPRIDRAPISQAPHVVGMNPADMKR